MNLMGIGLPELLVIFLIAFLALGPNRSISMARTAGKVLGDLRRTFSEVAAAVDLEEREPPPPRWEPLPSDRREEPPPKAGDE